MCKYCFVSSIVCIYFVSWMSYLRKYFVYRIFAFGPNPSSQVSKPLYSPAPLKPNSPICSTPFNQAYIPWLWLSRIQMSLACMMGSTEPHPFSQLHLNSLPRSRPPMPSLLFAICVCGTWPFSHPYLMYAKVTLHREEKHGEGLSTTKEEGI